MKKLVHLGCLSVCLLACDLGAGAGQVILRDGQKFSGRLAVAPTGIVVQIGGETKRTVPLPELARAVFDDVALTNEVAANLQPGVTINCRHSVPFAPLASSALGGKTGLWSDPEKSKKEQQPRPKLTDSMSPVSANEPDWLAGEVVWDLGTNPPPSERQLDVVHVWIRADDKGRCDYAGSLAVSDDGDNFIPLAGTATNINFREMPGKANWGDFNLVCYQFEPLAVTDFRYLKLIAAKPELTEETRFVEVEALVKQIPPVPPPKATVMLRNGSQLRGQVAALGDDGLQIRVEKELHQIPLNRLAGIQLRRVPFEFQSALRPGRRGLLLSNGDFFEGEIGGFSDGTVKATSVIFGARTFMRKGGVLALVFRETDPAPAKAVIKIRNGSVIHAQEINCAEGRLQATDAVLGQLNLNDDCLLELVTVLAP